MSNDDLVEWLRAQLDSDEQAAMTAAAQAGPNWIVAYYDNSDQFADGVDGDNGEVIGSGDVAVPEAEHIARWDPARVLREVEKTRRILDLHPHQRFTEPLSASSPFEEDRRPAFDEVPRYVGCKNCNWDAAMEELRPGWWCETVRLLASPYSDRPDYRDEWRPA